MRKRNNRNFRKPVIAGFGAMYVLTMGLATCLVKVKFTEDYSRRFTEASAYISKTAQTKEFDMEEEGWSSQGARQDFYQSVANGYLWRVDDENLQISVGFYDRDKTLMARTRDQIGGNAVYEASTKIRDYASFCLDEYLTSEEKEQLAKYQWEMIHFADLDKPDPYRFSIRVSPDGQQLWGIYVQEITWTPEGEWKGEPYKDPLTGSVTSMDMVTADYGTGGETLIGSFKQTDSKILWQWTAPELGDKELAEGTVLNTSMQLPYMTSYETWRDYESWKTWCRSRYLHDFPEKQEFVWEKNLEEPNLVVDSDGLYYRGKYQLKIGMVDDPSAYMEIRMESRPWLAALDYMKYVYLAGFALALACVVKIISAFQKVYDAREAQEETRRDFTNAMAHELKTPLGIIRNFAENLMEHNMEEKQDYYLAQIIGQTEEMDQLLTRMIHLSRLDSEELLLKKEPLSCLELIREQQTKLEPVLLERKIQVRYEGGEDFTIHGDREYLSMAIWNLLSNGADYNLPGGSITIRTKSDECSIENTGTPLTQDQLLHAFDLFYTGNKSRSRQDGHMGMGLFLAKKIFKLHGLELTMENAEDGVRVRISYRLPARRTSCGNCEPH